MRVSVGGRMGVLVGGQVSKDWQTFVPGFADDVELLNDAKVKADKLLESLMSGDNDLTKTLQNKKVWNMAHCVMFDHALRVGFQTIVQKCCPAYPVQLLAANEYRYLATMLGPHLHDDCCAHGVQNSIVHLQHELRNFSVGVGFRNARW